MTDAVEIERSWLVRIAAGDRLALEELYHAYRPRLSGFLFRLLGDGGEVAEVLNDVLLTIWQKADQFEGRSRPSTWILGIARFKAWDVLEKRRSFVALDDLEEQPPPAALEVGASEKRTVLRQYLERGLIELSPEHREVLHLAFVQGLSYGEIAALVGCPENTVKTRVYHAKRRLQPILERLSEGPSSGQPGDRERDPTKGEM